jgi:ribonucleoside-diphosphate reductase alpha chain
VFKQDPYEDINFVKKQCIITNNKGEKIFDEEIEFPDDFDDNCAAIVASRYLCNNAKLKETSIKQMIDRVSDTIAYNGIQNKYFLNEELKTQFANKLKYYQIHRYFAFNSPVYFNVGLQEVPQSSACFILSIDDTMDSIFETTKLESRIFKNGSGSGMNLSNLRSNKETLSSGGFASGPVSFLKVMDTSAGVIRSGGTLRRSAKLGCLNDTHPDIDEFIDCKVYEELKLEILREAKLPNRPGYDLNDEIFYQNTNLSVQASNDFMNAAINNSDWSTKFRNGEICKTYKAQELLMKMAENCWKMADPGLQFSDTINKFNTVKNDGKIKSSNPCLPIWAPIKTSTGYRYLKTLNNKIFIKGLELNCSDVIKTGENKDVYEILLKNGMSVYATNNHKISTDRGDINLEDLKFNDYIEMDYSSVPYNHNQEEYEQGFIAGYLFSDGSIINDASGRRYISFSLGIKEFDLETNLINLLNKHIPNINNQKFEDHYQKPDTCKILTIHKNLSCDIVFKDIFKASSKDDFNLLNDDKSLSYQKGFIEAFITFDGHVLDRQYTKVIKANQSGNRGWNILKQMQLSLASLGIYSSLSINNHSKDVERDGNFYHYKTSWSLEINDVWEFEKQFTLFNSEKQKRINNIISSPKKHPTRITNLKRYQEIKNIFKVSTEDVYDINVPEGHHFVTSGAIVHNCGEYLFLEDSSCNLASLNLIRFFSHDEYGNIVFDIDSFIDVIQTVITAQDILIDFSSFPSEKIKENSINYRPLGLGYTNLGALLMWLGLPYDSDDGRNITSLLTGIMQGYALTASSELAGRVGRFNRFDDNKLSYFDVIKEHSAAAQRLHNDIKYTKNDLIRILNNSLFNIWDEIITNIDLDDFSLRNAQVSVIAPTGTISFLMNAQTTGCEPEFAHVRYKTLSSSDGAQIKIISPIIKESLENLKYSDFEVDYIINYLIENETLEDCKYIKPEHLAIFDTSMKSGHSNRVINWHAHLSMLAAIQPFVSGGISKTISVPEDFTVQQIYDIFIESWKLGIKSLTLYRDNSKSFQPISTKKSTDVKTIEVIQPKRNKLPNDRDAKTHAFKIGNVKGYLTAGFYPDTNKLGEIFINISKEGSTLSGFADSLATIISIALQYNVPLKEFVRKLSHVKFEPNGFTDNPDIRIAHSLIDYIFRFLGLKYLSKEDQKDLGLLVNKLDVEEILDDLQIAEEVIKKDYDSSPICSDCGGIMIRKGTCYTCTNCAVNNGSCG